MTSQTIVAPVSSLNRSRKHSLPSATSWFSGLLAVPGFLQICISNGLTQSFGHRMQPLAVGWLVLEMTDSAFWLGIINGLPVISIVLLSLVGGVLADRLDSRRVLIASRGALSLAAVVVALLASTGSVQLAFLLVYVLITIGIAAIDMPVARSLMLDAVGTGRLLSASAAQSAVRDIFNIAMPVAMGLLIGAAGPGSGFWALAAGYLAAMLLAVRARPHAEQTRRTVVTQAGQRQTGFSGLYPPEPRPSMEIRKKAASSTPLRDIVAALAYIRTEPAVAVLVLLGFLVPFAGIYFAMMPVYAREVLNVGAGGLGALAASFSSGSLLGSLYLTARGSMSRRSSRLTVVGAVFGTGMMVFALSDSFAVSCGVSFVMGVCAGLWLNLLTTLVQVVSAPDMRGRVASVSTMAYQLIGLGWLIGGVFASLVGLEATVFAGGTIFTGGSIAAYAISKEMRAIN